MDSNASSSSLIPQNHLRLLTRCTIASRVLTLLLIWLSSHLPLFDSSSKVLVDDSTFSLTTALLRWDAFHFAQIARDGYVYEHQWAFFPGTPMVMNLASRLMRFTKPAENSIGWVDILQGGALASLCCDSTQTLYHLSLYHLKSPSLALLASLLSLLPSSPATLRYAGYSEPFFTFFSYKGMLSCARRQWFRASCYFVLAATFRSNGFLLGGYILWGLIIRPSYQGKAVRLPSLSKIGYAVALTTLTFIPFIFHQYTAYRNFCTSTDLSIHLPSWCHNTVPSIYAHVQSRYWNVGFLRYWTLAQAPNILIASPVLALLSIFSLMQISNAAPRILSNSKHKQKLDIQASPFFIESLTPHAILASILVSILLFASHTQIALRQAAAVPITYWAAAWLIVERPWWGRIWIIWSVVWGAISIVLWTAFLPPA
ncbi:glycosyltransferase family 76 protein [Heterobasidion irregulare TC 32-1]|uniref:GPI mannosyltransferase 2 n=1 Tax=Heterobasidion irregulare (strain TC 32-1) TaxID=747525 RepID=W4K3Z1_HETIT|nr:glycosyltransferase family 76 protein [Heterobasidion irregulare TC 32-1]ETW80459.1 glycosyltransferase family 76 protein [Heterobasidion irregulare TC 32-1]